MGWVTLERRAPGYLRAGMGRALRVDPEALGLKLSSLTGYKLSGIRFYRRNYYVKKRSKRNNRRAVEAVEDARTSA
jgi:hypothetical protein